MAKALRAICFQRRVAGKTSSNMAKAPDGGRDVFGRHPDLARG